MNGIDFCYLQFANCQFYKAFGAVIDYDASQICCQLVVISDLEYEKERRYGVCQITMI